MKLKLSLGFLFELCEVIMVVNISPILLNILWLVMAFSIIFHVHIHLNKMRWLSERIDIVLKQLSLF